MTKIIAERMGEGPIIRPHMDTRMGDNINGPSLIRVPDWLTDPLGKYYLYFGHHDGRYIRLAYADRLAGPWQMYEPGVLPLEASQFAGHLASPDVLVDNQARQLRLYYHGADTPTGEDSPQYTRVALSTDGISFSSRKEILGRPYMRTVPFDGGYLSIAMPGIFYRSGDGLTSFEEGINPFPPNMRHAALMWRQKKLIVFYSNIGDRPERLLVCGIDARKDWRDWKPDTAIEVLRPELDYEGAGLELKPSSRGMANVPENAIRDPAIFEEAGETYLLYSTAGESGIGMARIHFEES